MAKNDFKPFAIGENSNVLSQAEYEELTALASGFQTGTAFSEQLNKVWRQSSVMSSVLADFVAQQSGDDVLDDSNVVKLKASLLKALLQYSTSQLDPRYLKSASNLSEISNKDTARDNLGVYSKQISDGKYLQILSNLADVPNKDVARDNLGVYSKPLTDGKYLQVGNELFEIKNKENARYNIGLKSAAVCDIGSSSGTVAAGDDVRIVNSLDKRVGGVISGAISSSFPDTYRIVANNIGQFWRMDGSALYLLLTNRGDPYGTYNSLRPLSVNTDTGNVSMAHRVDIGELHTNNNIFIGSTVLQGDGNIQGSAWGGYLNNFISNQVNSRATPDYVNQQVNGRATWDYVNGTFIRGFRLSSSAWTGAINRDSHDFGSGGVITGIQAMANYAINLNVCIRYIQVNINNNWLSIASI